MVQDEFTGVILASGNDGDNLFPLTDGMPHALLPIANRPLISFQLELLERSRSFHKVLVLTVEQWLPLLSTFVSEQYKGPLQIELLIVPDGAGSADAIRHISHKLLTDFVLIAGDVISDVSFQRMADLHRLSTSGVTVLFKEAPPREPGVAKKARDLDGLDFVGLDHTRTRLLSLEAAADCDRGVVSVSQSMMRVFPNLELHTDLIDAHIYIFSHWVLDVCARALLFAATWPVPKPRPPTGLTASPPSADATHLGARTQATLLVGQVRAAPVPGSQAISPEDQPRPAACTSRQS